MQVNVLHPVKKSQLSGIVEKALGEEIACNWHKKPIKIQGEIKKIVRNIEISVNFRAISVTGSWEPTWTTS
jgi:hypothetical protein